MQIIAFFSLNNSTPLRVRDTEAIQVTKQLKCDRDIDRGKEPRLVAEFGSVREAYPRRLNVGSAG